MKTTLNPGSDFFHGSNKFEIDSNNNDTEVPEDLPEEQALQLKVKDFVCRSKAKTTPQGRKPADSSPRIVLIGRRNWIDIGRTEDLCRQMDDLADEEHTRRLTSQVYFYYKSNWWLRSNKTGSNTMPVQRRSEFKQALSTLQQLKTKRRRSSQKSTMGTEFFFFVVELARFLVDSLFL